MTHRMQEPVLMGADLLAASDAALVPGETGVWPLGQSGLLLTFPGQKVYVDLYLSNHCEAVLELPFDHRRLSRAPLDPAEITDADVVICSHDHLDHLDVPTLRTLAKSSPAAVVVAPEACRELLQGLGWEASRVRGTRGGETITHGSLSITSFPVPHDDYDEDAEHGHRYQGYLIDDGRVAVAHVGDARSDGALGRRLAELSPDLLCLPINGRDEHRRALGFAGNMNAEEAYALAVGAGARHVLPMHYDMFAQNVDAGALARFLAAAAASAGGPVIVRPALGAGTVVRAAVKEDVR